MRKLINGIRAWWLAHRAAALYRRYHRSIMEDQLEAQRTHQLPESTIRARNRFNRVVSELQRVKPGTKWREM